MIVNEKDNGAYNLNLASELVPLHCGLRNFNIGVCAFLRNPRPGEPEYDELIIINSNNNANNSGAGGCKQNNNNNNNNNNNTANNNANTTNTNANNGASSCASKNAIDNAVVEAEARKKAMLLVSERTELLRLSGLLFGFARHMLREQRLGYPDNAAPGDKQLICEDKFGKPAIGKAVQVDIMLTLG